MTLALLLAACGSGGDDTESGTGGSTTDVPAVDAEADQTAADEAIVALEEVLAGKGFVAEADDEDDEDDGDDFEFVSESCRRFDDAFPDEMPGETAEADMDSHEREDEMAFESVEASIGMTESAEDLADLMALVSDEEMGDCLGEAIELGAEEDQADPDAPPFEVQGIEVATDEVEGLGDENVRFEVGLTMLGAGLEIPMTFEMLMVRDDRVVVMAMVGAGGLGDVEATLDAQAAAEVLLDALPA